MDIRDIELYRNDDIKIDFPLPEGIRETVDELDKLYDEKKDLDYNLLLNTLEMRSKYALMTDRITNAQYNALLDRYGAWW